MRFAQINTNSQLKCPTECIRFFVLTKPSVVRRYLRYVERNEAKSGRKRWCADWAILTRISIIRGNQPLTAPAVTPSMNWLCAMKNTTRLGRMEIRETAITRFHAKPVSASMLMRTNSVAG